MISLQIPEMPVIPVIAEDNTHIVIVATNGDHLALKKPLSQRWAIRLSPEGKTTGIQLKEKKVVSQADACRSCSFNHYDEEGGNYCGIASFTNESVCPRTGGRF